MPYRGDDGVFLKDEVIELNNGLKNWAYELTRGVPLQDTEEMRVNREQYTEHPVAQKPAEVFLGDILACERFWHGRIYTEWAQRWVKLWTEDEGTFAMTNTDDMGVLRGLKALDAVGKADFSRAMLIRSASNFCMQPPGMTAIENLASEESEEDRYPAYLPSMENMYRVGSRVVSELVDNWNQWESEVPGF
jgi:purine nucleoside permease